MSCPQERNDNEAFRNWNHFSEIIIKIQKQIVGYELLKKKKKKGMMKYAFKDVRYNFLLVRGSEL